MKELKELGLLKEPQEDIDFEKRWAVAQSGTTTTTTITSSMSNGDDAPTLSVLGNDHLDLETGLYEGGKNNTKESREEKMKELDDVKDSLTEDEYYAKRAEILSDV